jgi:hypothetical protein
MFMKTRFQALVVVHMPKRSVEVCYAKWNCIEEINVLCVRYVEHTWYFQPFLRKQEKGNELVDGQCGYRFETWSDISDHSLNNFT